ncbi:MAG TPA: hypothetical protein VE913_13445 [Longimicrobium sp.]|nr:hypothetical protein [Longimicrobium sp.]
MTSVMGWRLIRAALVLVLATPAAAQRPPASSLALLRSAAGAGMEGDDMERAGRFADALDRYTAATGFTDRALDDFGQHGIQFQARPRVAYFLAGRSHFDAARMQVKLRRSPTDVSHHLNRARQAMDGVLILDGVAARQARRPYTDDAWKYLFMRGQIQLLRGDLPAAQQDYEQVVRLNRGYRPAMEALGFISYARGSAVRGATSDGDPLPPKPAPVLSRAQLVDLVFDFAGLIYRKYSAELAIAQKVTQAMMQ